MKKFLLLSLLICCYHPIRAQFCFSDAFPFNFGNAPKSIVTGDFDADGKLDLLTYNEGPHNLTVAKGNGLGNFATPTAATTTSNMPAITAMIAADINNDGKLDIVMRAGSAGHLFLGNNSGTFTLAPNNGSPFPTLNGVGMAVGHFNTDVYLDVAVSQQSRIVIAYGSASGFFTNNLEIIVPPGLSGSNDMSKGTLVAQDFNSDGLVDFAVNNEDDSSLTVLVNDGSDNYFATNYLFPANSSFDRPLKTGDFNGDGNIDLLSVSSSNFGGNTTVIKVFLGDGLGGFANSVSTPTINQNYSDYQIADFDADGILDIASNNQDAVKFSKGTGTGSFEAPQVFYTSQYADAYFIQNNFVSGDFNADGKPDIATANFNNTVDGHKVSVLLNTRLKILTTTPATRCGSGIVTLSATADSGTIEWYSSPTNINSVATGASFTTPTLTATTTYYVSTSNITCESERIPVVATVISNVNPTALAASAITTSAATLNWTVQNAPAAGYDYYYSTISTAPTASTTPSGTATVTTVSLNALSAATTYYFWVRSNCGGTAGNWVGTSFSTLAVGCNAPSALNSTGLTTTSATLNWTAANPVPSNGYQYYYSTSNTPPTAATVPSGTTALNSVTLNTLSAATIYYFWVRSNCGATAGNWIGTSFTTLAAGCNAPSALSVTGITAAGATVNWTAANPAPVNGYQYYYNTNTTAPTASTTPSGNASGTTATLVGLNASTVYYYWVRSNCGASQSNWIAGTSFTTSAVVTAGCTSASFGLWPTSTFTPSCTGTSELIVDNAYAGEYSYVNITTNKQYTFSSSVTTDYVTIANNTGTVVLAHGPSPLVWPSGTNSGEARYYFHTNVSCGEQNTDRSRFISCSPVLSSEAFDSDSLKLFPNPTTQLLNIANDVSIDRVLLFNLLGQLVKEQNLHAKEGVVDMAAFSAGTYFVRIIVGDTSKTLKVLKE